MAATQEKRRYHRFEFQKAVQVFPVLPSKSGHIYEVQQNPLKVWANDISEGGLRLETSQSFNENFLLKLNFEVEEEKTVEVYGKIIWSRDSHCGVRFMLADQEMRKGIKSLAKKKA